MNKTILLTSMIVLLSGCAMAPVDRTDTNNRKAQLQTCVAGFLDKDVSPVDSLNICSSIYSRWEPSTTRDITPAKAGQ